MTGRVCKAVICCAKAVVASERVGWGELAAQVRQTDKMLQTHISARAVDDQAPGVFTEEQLEDIITAGEAIYETAIGYEDQGKRLQSRFGDRLANIVYPSTP